MNKYISALVLGSVIASVSGYYWYQTATIKPQEKIHGLGTKKLSCPDEKLFSLQLSYNNKNVWKKSHKKLLDSDSSQPYLDRRFTDKSIYPVYQLIHDYKNITAVEFIPCEGNKIMMSASEILNSPEIYFLGPNRRGRMKLLKYEGNNHYNSMKRNIIEINIIE